MTFGARLRSAREKLGVSQERFATLGGVKRVSQHLYEQNVRVPDLNYLLGLHEHGIDIGYLILGESAWAPKVPLLKAAFRAVDEFAQDKNGKPLPYPERERFFSFLCAALAQDDSATDMTELQAKLSKFVGARA